MTKTLRPTLRPTMAGALALTILFTVCVRPALATERATLSGRVLDADGITTRSGVVVLLLDHEQGLEYRSAATTSEGAFHVDGAPAGTYVLLVETDGGAFLAAERLKLEAGGNRPLALTLAEVEDGRLPATGWAQQSAGLAFWAKVTIAGVIGVAALVAIDEATSDDEQPATSF